MSSQPRPSPRSAGQASSHQINPSRTNNDRDRLTSRENEYDSFDRTTAESNGSANSSTTERAVKQADKIRQVTQNFFRRAALTIVNSRVTLAPAFNAETNQTRSSKWFQLIMDESDELADDVDPWVHVNVNEERPSSMIVEIYLDTGDLTRNQTLVVVDERGKKWDVCEAMKAPSNSSSGQSSSGKSRGKRERSPQIILERWRIHLDEQATGNASGANEPMANVYKKAVIMFRSLFSYARFLPAWKLARCIAKEPATLMALRPMYRVIREGQTGGKDSLTASFYPSAEPTCQTYNFAPVRSPAGAFNIDVTYRRNCNFRVADYEALVSSYYMGMDQPGEPSSLGDGDGDGLQYPVGQGHEVGSLPVNRKWAADRQELNHAYGSLSTFHHAGHGTGTSPISALRAVRDSQISPDAGSPPLKMQPNHRTLQSSKSSLKSSEAPPPTQRRVSVSFQPFKAGSLSSSPGQAGLLSQSPTPGSLQKTSNISQGLAQARNRNATTALPQAALRVPQPLPSPELPGSPGSSPKAPPITRYSSSFGHRRSKMSSGGGSGSRVDEDNSSGKGSGNSSKRGSVTLVEGDGGSGSSGSMQTDDDNISDFLSLLEQKKDLKSFNKMDDASRDASARRTASALNRYRGLRDSTAVLSDSMTSSMMMRHSSGSSSQRLSGIPPTLAGASVSTSSSPGKPISPHTPHTPAIPSRLSEQATIRSDRDRSGNRGHSSSASPTNDELSDSSTSRAIPIPTSPSRFPHVRRSSSAHQRNRAGMVDLEQFDMRPASLPVDDRPDLSLSEMVQMQQSSFEARRETPVAEQQHDNNSSSAKTASAEHTGAIAVARSHHASARPRISRGVSGSGSTLSSGRGSGSRFSFSNRPGAVSTGDDEEPLLFTMSELGRRSLEDMRGQGSSVGGSGESSDRVKEKGSARSGRMNRDW